MTRVPLPRLRLLARWILGATVLIAACTRTPRGVGLGTSDAGDVGRPADGGPGSALIRSIGRAEDRRRAADVPDEARTAHDPAVRRLAARALARIGDATSERSLLQALSDEDPQTAGWAAYGLGWACKGHEEAHVRALAARAVALGVGAPVARTVDEAGAATATTIDPRLALVRAVGRCGGELAEQVLSAWVRARGGWAEGAALALGDIAGRKGQLADETATALLDAASEPELAVAIYPFARVERIGDAFVPRVLKVARSVVARPAEARIFAIRALSRCGGDAAVDLLHVVESKELTSAERAEAARGLKLLGEPGRASVALALGQLTPDKDPFAITALGGDDFGVLRTLVGSLGSADDAPRAAEPALRASPWGHSARSSRLRTVHADNPPASS